MMTRFQQSGVLPVSVDEAWSLFIRGLSDSPASPIWPRGLSRARLESPVLERGARIRVTYRLGPLKSSVHYELARFEPPHRVEYRTLEDHPLKGGASISLIPLEGGSGWRWSGAYSPKNAAAYPALIGFKAVFEPLFFRALRKRISETFPFRADTRSGRVA